MADGWIVASWRYGLEMYMPRKRKNKTMTDFYYYLDSEYKHYITIWLFCTLPQWALVILKRSSIATITEIRSTPVILTINTFIDLRQLQKLDFFGVLGPRGLLDCPNRTVHACI